MTERQLATRGLRARWIWFVLVALIAALGWWFMSDSKNDASKGPPAGFVPMVPVRTEVARIEDLDIYLRGLGTVTAFNTVTVRSRVQGEIIAVQFKEGEQVQAGTLLAEIDPRSFKVALNQAMGVLQQDQAQLTNAKRDLERYKKLRQQDSIAPMILDTQQSLVQKLEGVIKSDQAAVDNAQLQLDYTRITAPISGRLGLRRVDAGNLVVANDPQGMVVITQTRPIAVVFTLAENDLPAVRQAMTGAQTLQVEAYDRADLVRLAQGTLLTVDNQIDVTTGTIKLKAEFKNETDALFPNQFVNVRMKVRTDKSVLTIPAGALQQGNQGAFLYVILPDDTAAVKQVKVGARSGDRVAILEGLMAGDRVVLEGTDRLRAGAKVRVISGGAGGSGAARPATSPPAGKPAN